MTQPSPTGLDLINELRRSPLAADEVIAVVRNAIACIAGCDVVAVSDTSSLDSLGLDSLALTEVLIEVEESLQLELPDELLARLQDVDTSLLVRDICWTVLE